jgi:hypothetical protein
MNSTEVAAAYIAPGSNSARTWSSGLGHGEIKEPLRHCVISRWGTMLMFDVKKMQRRNEIRYKSVG